MTEIEVKLNRLVRELRLIDCPVIAFSGGVLSTFLATVAQKILGTQVYAVTIMVETCPFNECTQAKEKAKQIGVEHFVLDIRNAIGSGDLYQENPCSFCDELQQKLLKRWAKEKGFRCILEGSCEAFCLSQGGRQFKEAVSRDFIRRPVAFAELTRDDVVAISRGWGIMEAHTRFKQENIYQ